jgi:hypothetical protein
VLLYLLFECFLDIPFHGLNALKLVIKICNNPTGAVYFSNSSSCGMDRPEQDAIGFAEIPDLSSISIGRGHELF